MIEQRRVRRRVNDEREERRRISASRRRKDQEVSRGRRRERLGGTAFAEPDEVSDEKGGPDADEQADDVLFAAIHDTSFA
jgi:hypothetical protein